MTLDQEFDAAIRRYFRRRVAIAGSENLQHVKQCVHVFVEAALISETNELAAHLEGAESRFAWRL